MEREEFLPDSVDRERDDVEAERRDEGQDVDEQEQREEEAEDDGRVHRRVRGSRRVREHGRPDVGVLAEHGLEAGDEGSGR